MVTGMRGLCNGLGPAMFGLVFYMFHVDLNGGDEDGPTGATDAQHMESYSQASYNKLNQNVEFKLFSIRIKHCMTILTFLQISVICIFYIYIKYYISESHYSKYLHC